MREIVLVFRKPFYGQVSIEYLFYSISDYLSRKNVPVSNFQLPHYNKGVLNRLRNLGSLTSLRNRIVHVTGDAHYALLGALFSKRVLTIHDFNFMLNKGIAGRFIYWLLWIYLPVKFCHRITVISQNTRKELLQYTRVAEDKIHVIGDFIDGIYQYAGKRTVASTPRILQIGTTFNKNLERLIEAVSSIRCILVIIGKLDKGTVELLDKHQVNYENRSGLSLEALYQEYVLSDLLCYVSTSEGFGMPILEAQATGVPVVTSNCSSMPEVAGEAALLVDPFDVLSIRCGIEEVLSNDQLRNDLREKGLVNVKRFSKQVIAEKYLELYKGL